MSERRERRRRERYERRVAKHAAKVDCKRYDAPRRIRGQLPHASSSVS